MRCLVFSISFEVQCWHDVLTRRTRWSNNLNTCVDIVWILHGFRTRARHTRTLHAHVIRTLHAHATRALLKHPPYSLSAAPSGQPEAGRTAVDPSHAPAAHTHATHTHARTRARDARTRSTYRTRSTHIGVRLSISSRANTRHTHCRRPPPDSPRLDGLQSIPRTRCTRTRCTRTKRNARTHDAYVCTCSHISHSTGAFPRESSKSAFK